MTWLEKITLLAKQDARCFTCREKISMAKAFIGRDYKTGKVGLFCNRCKGGSNDIK